MKPVTYPIYDNMVNCKKYSVIASRSMELWPAGHMPIEQARLVVVAHLAVKNLEWRLSKGLWRNDPEVNENYEELFAAYLDGFVDKTLEYARRCNEQATPTLDSAPWGVLFDEVPAMEFLEQADQQPVLASADLTDLQGRVRGIYIALDYIPSKVDNKLSRGWSFPWYRPYSKDSKTKLIYYQDMLAKIFSQLDFERLMEEMVPVCRTLFESNVRQPVEQDISHVLTIRDAQGDCDEKDMTGYVSYVERRTADLNTVEKNTRPDSEQHGWIYSLEPEKIREWLEAWSDKVEEAIQGKDRDELVNDVLGASAIITDLSVVSEDRTMPDILRLLCARRALE